MSSKTKRLSRFLKRRSNTVAGERTAGTLALPPIAEVEDDEVKWPDPNTKAEEYLLVVDTHEFRSHFDRVAAGVAGIQTTDFRVAVYPFAATGDDRFKTRYGANGFDLHKLHKRHPVHKTTGGAPTYIPVDDFVRTMDEEMAVEIIYIFGDLGAKCILLNKSMYDAAKRAREGGVQFTAPALPLPVAVGASGDGGRETSTSNANTHLGRAIFAEPAHNPHVRERWFLDNGQHPGAVMELVTKVLNKDSCSATELELSFSSKHEHKRLQEMQAGICEAIGVAVKTTHSELNEFDYVFKVELFDEKYFKDLKDFGTDSSASQVQDARRSLASFATQRARFYGSRAYYREDILFPDGHSEPADSWVKEYDSMQDRLMSLNLGSVMTVDLVLYGPHRQPSADALFAWRTGCCAGPAAFPVEWIRHLRERERPNAIADGAGFMSNVRFDPEQGGENMAQIRRDGYEALSQKHTLKLVVHRTYDAADVFKDKTGDVFPFGVRVLVLDIGVVDAIRIQVAEASTDEAVAKAAKEVAAIEKLLGPRRADDDASAEICGRYPPMCAVLTNSESLGDASNAETVAQFVKDTFAIPHVFPMPTFQAPADDHEAKFRDDFAYRRRFVEEWDRVAGSVLTVFNSVVDHIVDHEFKKYRLHKKPTKFERAKNALLGS